MGANRRPAKGKSARRSETPPAETPSRDAERLLLVLQESAEPVGARLAARMLADAGTTTSEASVSRIFLQLDGLGLTEAIGRKGRVLTAMGRQYAAKRLSDQQRNEDFSRALDIRNVQQLGDWLHARRGIECEMARVAARRARKTDINRLSRLLGEHERKLATGADPTPVAMRFHQELAKAANSPLFAALMNSLHGPELVPLEELLDTITGGHGTLGESTSEHTELLDALRDHDEDAAEGAMRAHLDRLIAEVDEFASGRLGDLLPKLLSLRPTA